jgi:ribosomal protein L12E/L44/L45/RPP1/RPP2
VKEAAPDEVVESVRALEEMDVDEFMRSDAMMGVGDSDEEEDDEGGVAEEEGEGGEEEEEEEEGEVEEDDGSGESDDEEVAGLKNSVST